MSTTAQVIQWTCIAVGLVWLAMSTRPFIDTEAALTRSCVFIAASFVIGACA